MATRSITLQVQWWIFYHFIIVVTGFAAHLGVCILQRRNKFPYLTPRIVAFGIDGPQVAKKMSGEIFVCILSCLGLNLLQERLGVASQMFNILCLLFDIVLCYYFYTKGKYVYNLLYGSLVSKYYGSDQLITRLLNTFDEHHVTKTKNKNTNKKSTKKEIIALDAGCGSGMITIIFSKLFFKLFGKLGIFKKLSMFGADKWISVEQSNSSETNVIYNLRAEGLTTNIDNKKKNEKKKVDENEIEFDFNIQTCDLRDMPFEDGKFDLVMSSLVMHIINQRKFDKASKKERKKAVESLIRVLSPNKGILAIWDIIHAHEYLEVITSHKCMVQVQCIPVTCSYTMYANNYIIIAVKEGCD